MMKSKVTKTNLVLEHLKNKGSITSIEAIEMFGATRLSSIIFNLRKQYKIETINVDFVDRYGNKSVYAKYIYHGEITKKE